MSNDKGPPVSIKTEPGTYKRLPSFRNPRDLKLSEFTLAPNPNPSLESRPKKVYVPNFNVQRKKVDEAQTSSENHSPKGAERGRRGAERSRGRGRKVPNLVQGSGVFSEGLAPSVKTSRWSNRTSETSHSYLMKPKLNLNDKIEIDKEEEELVMKELLRDDFLDNPELEPDFEHCPINLPLCQFETKYFKKEEVKEEKPIAPSLNGVKVKKEKEVEEGKPLVEEKPRSLSQMKPLSIQELLGKSIDKSFIFLQLPNTLPGLDSSEEPSGQSTSKGEPVSVEEPEKKGVLSNLPSGRVGKVQILKSGRARLILGDAHLWVEPGTQPSFRQDLMSIPLNPTTLSGSMVNLGPITSRMIVSPDWESMLSLGIAS